MHLSPNSIPKTRADINWMASVQTDCRLTLTWGQRYHAWYIACARQQLAQREGRINTRGLVTSTPKELHLLGARCELAAKIFLDPIHWNAVLDSIHNTPDLFTEQGLKIDVKGVDHDSKHLLIRCDEPVHRDWAYVLVSGERHPEYWLRGWIWGSDVTPDMRAEPEPGRPCYLVPHGYLRNISDLLLEAKNIRSPKKELVK